MNKKQTGRKIRYAVGILLVFLLIGAFFFTNKKITNVSIKEKASAAVWDTHLPLFAFINQAGGRQKGSFSLTGLALMQLPLHKYLMENIGYQVSVEDDATYELILRSEGNDENSVDEHGNVIASEGDVGVEKTLNEETKPVTPEVSGNNLTDADIGAQFKKALAKSKEYDMNQFSDFEKLVGEFYAVDRTTTVDAAQLNTKALLEKDMRLKTPNDQPQILIYHTHSQEGYVDTVQGDDNTGILGVGERLATILREQYGYNVLHDMGKYDVESRDYAYSNSAPAIEKILQENPSIEVIIDLHRDGISGDKKLVTDLNGRPTAQFMFFNGLSRTKSRGDIEYLANPYIADNLSFAFQMQIKCNEYYPGVTRKIYLKGYRYNMHYRPKTLLIELGAQTNTVEEIKNACDPIAHVLHMVLSGEEPGGNP